MVNQIIFQPATKAHKPLIKTWWNKPHVVEFWDNSKEMWQNVENYLDHGIKDLFDYYVGLCDGVPFSLVMTVNNTQAATHPDHLLPFLTKSGEGETLGFDFMIGKEEYLGKGLAAPTLKAFMDFCPPEITRFLIDPALDNPRAIHVYEKAGFTEVGKFTPKQGSFAGKMHVMMRCERGE